MIRIRARRANPFSKVTDLICRLPSSILFQKRKVINLRDLMRLLVRKEKPNEI